VKPKEMTMANIYTSTTLKLASAMMLIATIGTVSGFISPALPRITHRTNSFLFTTSTVSTADQSTAATSDSNSNQESNNNDRVAVRVPLKYMGPYPCLGLRFPDLATSSQRARNISGISLDFLLDTAANFNTINAQVAKELDMIVVGQAPPGMAAGGAMVGGNTFLLGDCQLEGIPEHDSFTFLQELTASALPVASPVSAGLLSLPFFYSFEGGVEFDWKGHREEQHPPSVTFYGAGESDAIRQSMTKVSITELPITRLPTVQLFINNITIPALLDTGSPITVINAQAAKEAGLVTVDIGTMKQGGSISINPFANLANRFQEAQAVSQAAARGDILTIAGSTGEPIQLLKSASKTTVRLSGSGDGGGVNEEETVDFGSSHFYVGNLPGLAALNGLGDDSPPAAVLGMDVLLRRPKMLLVARDQEVYF
jgi:hypothetical protein